MLMLLMLALVTPTATTWTVDVNGGGDFTQISQAVVQVPAGDVLLVEPGTYDGFTLTKRLTILGPVGGTRPYVAGVVQLQLYSFTLAGIDMDELLVANVAGRGRIDDCRVNVVKETKPETAVTVLNCAELVISRTTARGETEYGDSDSTAGTGMSIGSSRVTLVQCQVFGGAGDDQDSSFSGPYPGGTGLRVVNGIDVVLAGTSVYGGPGGWPQWTNQGAPGGPGIDLKYSTLRVRGDSTDTLEGGEPGFNYFTYGNVIYADDSTIVSSGIEFGSGALSLVDTLHVQPAVAEPFLSVGGDAGPGGTVSVDLRGPNSATAFLAASFAPNLVALPGYDGGLWFEPAALLAVVPVVTAGQGVPVVLNVNLPVSTAGIEGTSYELQALFPTLQGALDSGKKFAGNVAELIIRF